MDLVKHCLTSRYVILICIHTLILIYSHIHICRAAKEPCGYHKMLSYIIMTCTTGMKSQVVEEQQKELLNPNRLAPHTLLSSLADLLFSGVEAQAAYHAVRSAFLLLSQPADNHSQLICLLPH